MERTEVLNRTERPCSFEWGKASMRHKVYYDGAEDMVKAIDNALTGERYLLMRIASDEADQVLQSRPVAADKDEKKPEGMMLGRVKLG